MNVAEFLPGIMEVLQTVDRSVLLLLKTNDCLRSANARLGGRATETYIVTAEYCLKALGKAGPQSLNQGDDGDDEGSWGGLHLGWRAELWQASARIAAFRTLRWWRERGQPEDGEGGATGQQGQSGGGSSVRNGNDAILK
jgi:hypothetical protein